MKHLIIILLSILSVHFSYSQINEIGVFMGGNNFIGDVGATNYISPNSPTLGLMYKWNASPRHSWRASIIYSDLNANDNESDDPRRIQRGFDFDSNLLEISAGLEFNFLDFDLHSEQKLVTPYIYSGISLAKHDDYYYLNGVQTSENSSSWTFGIPMILGIKATFINQIILGIEVGARYTFSDNIDGSFPESQVGQQHRYGNINNKDWYVFSGITLTYTFGLNPCYCVN